MLLAERRGKAGGAGEADEGKDDEDGAGENNEEEAGSAEARVGDEEEVDAEGWIKEGAEDVDGGLPEDGGLVTGG